MDIPSNINRHNRRIHSCRHIAAQCIWAYYLYTRCHALTVALIRYKADVPVNVCPDKPGNKSSEPLYAIYYPVTQRLSTPINRNMALNTKTINDGEVVTDNRRIQAMTDIIDTHDCIVHCSKPITYADRSKCRRK